MYMLDSCKVTHTGSVDTGSHAHTQLIEWIPEVTLGSL